MWRRALCLRVSVWWGALLHEEMWLQVNKLTLACLLALRNDVLVPVVILLLVQASLILQVAGGDCGGGGGALVSARAGVLACVVQIKATSSSSSSSSLGGSVDGWLKLWMLFTRLFAYLSWLAAGLDIDGVETLGVLVSVVSRAVAVGSGCCDV